MGKKTIHDYDLLSLHIGFIEDEEANYWQIIEEKSIQVPHEDYDAETKLNPEQKVVFTIIIERINLRRSVFFIDGPRATSKTFLSRALLAQMRSRHLIALATETSDIVAAILSRGRTTHSRFILPLNPNDTDFCDFLKQDRIVELLREESLIIWDEASIEKRFVIEMVDRTLRNIMDSTSFFLYTIVGCNPWK